MTRAKVSKVLPTMHSIHCNQLKKLNVSKVKKSKQYASTMINAYHKNEVKPMVRMEGSKSSALSLGTNNSKK